MSIVCCGLFTGVPAIIMGRTALADIDSQPGAYSNRGTVFAGYICGMVGTVLSALGLLLTLLLAF